MTRTRTLSFITIKLFDLTYTCKLGPSEGTGYRCKLLGLFRKVRKNEEVQLFSGELLQLS